jgi:hypothetical protein
MLGTASRRHRQSLPENQRAREDKVDELGKIFRRQRPRFSRMRVPEMARRTLHKQGLIKERLSTRR